MQKLNSILLSAVIFAGLALHATAQEAEIEFVPGIKLKKKINKKREALLKKLVKITGKDGERVIEIEVDGDDKHEIIDLGDGNKAIIHVETEGDMDVFAFEHDDEHEIFAELEESESAHHEWLQMLHEHGPMAGRILAHTTNGNWRDLAMDILGNVEIELDGSPMIWNEFMGPQGIDLKKLHDAHSLDLSLGSHHMQLPLHGAKKLMNMLHGRFGDVAESEGACDPCPNCGCSCKSKKKGMALGFAPGPKKGKNKVFALKHGVPHKGSWASPSKKKGVATWVGPSKSKKGTVYFSGPEAKKKGKRAYSFMGGSPAVKPRHSVATRITPSKKNVRRRVLRLRDHEGEHHEEEHDEDDEHHEDEEEHLERQIRTLEREMRELRRQVRTLKRKI